MFVSANNYNDVLNGDLDNKILESSSLFIDDHLELFDITLRNGLLDYLEILNFKGNIGIEYIINNELRSRYKNLKLNFSLYKSGHYKFFNQFCNYRMHPEINFKNFLCSFNGSPHVGRQLLTSIIDNFGLFNEKYSSKNFKYTNEYINGHLLNFNLTKTQQQLYCKFFMNDTSYSNTVYSFGHIQYDHGSNIYNLEHKLTESFVHLVSETMPTSYYPFVTEKFLYSIVTRGLFVTYGQPNWHSHVEKYYGFKQYRNIFDYGFDTIKNPVKRLVRLMEMISKFSKLSYDDWNDLYLMEQDTIEFNYDHYFSNGYLKSLEKYE